jgi:hypothetical protein
MKDPWTRKVSLVLWVLAGILIAVVFVCAVLDEIGVM